MESPITSAALRAIRRILRAADQNGRRLAAATGLTPSQLLVLKEIERVKGITPGTISQALQFGQATVTNIIDKLEADGLVQRQRNDRDKRSILLSVTPRGVSALEAAPDLLQQDFREGFAKLPDWERAMILAGLERVGELLNISDTDAAPLIDMGIIDRTVDS